MKYLKDQRGAVLGLELVLVAVVLAVGGIGVYTAMHHKSSSTNATPTPAKSASPSPTQSLKSGVLGAQKISFSYPSTWSLTNTTTPVPNSAGTSGDMAILTSPGGLTVQLSTGLVGVGGGCGLDCKVASSESVAALGQNLYLNYEMDGRTNDVDTVMLADNQACASFCFINPTNRINGGRMYFYAYYGTGPSPVAKPLSFFKANNPDITSAKAIFSSLTYLK
ncbi:MAG: hypothetical protein NVS3B29_07870 [Candidatus Saccharimonadales bacterium]